MLKTVTRRKMWWYAVLCAWKAWSGTVANSHDCVQPLQIYIHVQLGFPYMYEISQVPAWMKSYCDLVGYTYTMSEEKGVTHPKINTDVTRMAFTITGLEGKPVVLIFYEGYTWYNRHEDLEITRPVYGQCGQMEGMFLYNKSSEDDFLAMNLPSRASQLAKQEQKAKEELLLLQRKAVLSQIKKFLASKDSELYDWVNGLKAAFVEKEHVWDESTQYMFTTSLAETLQHIVRTRL
jgi:hypothetical protein